jgi:hypothetical protein
MVVRGTVASSMVVSRYGPSRNGRSRYGRSRYSTVGVPKDLFILR